VQLADFGPAQRQSVDIPHLIRDENKFFTKSCHKLEILFAPCRSKLAIVKGTKKLTKYFFHGLGLS
jgi:hypothetical protein